MASAEDPGRDHRPRTARRRVRCARRTFAGAIDSLVRSLEARHPSTKGHSLRVARYALCLAEALGLDRGQIRRLSLAARLHDIGKIGTPDGILNKPGPLTEAEYAAVRRHPVVGERILAPVVRDPAVLAAVRGHHERFDGAGYPDALKGSQIPLLARILAVADCFDALTSPRAYRGALPAARALGVLRQGAGTQFDPALVGAFLALWPVPLASDDRTLLAC